MLVIQFAFTLRSAPGGTVAKRQPEETRNVAMAARCPQGSRFRVPFHLNEYYYLEVSQIQCGFTLSGHCSLSVAALVASGGRQSGGLVKRPFTGPSLSDESG